MERYRSAFYAPLVSDWRNAGQWAEDGAKTATERVGREMCAAAFKEYSLQDANTLHHRGHDRYLLHTLVIIARHGQA